MSKPAKQRRAEREIRERLNRQRIRRQKESVLERNERLLRGPITHEMGWFEGVTLHQTAILTRKWRESE